MGALPKKWIKWIEVLLGVVGMLTPALLSLGWIPANQTQNAILFLLGFIVVDLANAKESAETLPEPQLFTSSEDYFHALAGLARKAKYEVLSIAEPHQILLPETRYFATQIASSVKKEKQMHAEIIIAGRIQQWTREGFERRLGTEREVSLQGRYRYRVVDLPVSFGASVIDQKHWAITFPPNPSDPGGGAIVFQDHPEQARLVARFIRHQWLE